MSNASAGRVHLAFNLKECLAPVSDCIDQAIHLSLRGSQLSLKPCPISTLLAIAARAFLVIFANKQFDGFWIKQAFLNAGQHAPFVEILNDRAAVRAPPSVTGAGTAPVARPDPDPPCPTNPALAEPRKKMFGSSLLLRLDHRARVELILDTGPQVRFNDTKFRHRLDCPCAGLIRPNAHRSAKRLNYFASSIMDQLAIIEPIAKCAVTTLLAAGDC